MILRPTKLEGAWLVEPDRFDDERGFFARTWSRDEFAARGLETALAQCNVSYNRRAGTLRGMHYQVAPHEEVKLVRCSRGSLLDVIVDLRPESPTFGQWDAVELSAANALQLYIPRRFAHGFQTLEDDTEISYQISTAYHPESARGIRWNDPALGIVWPEAERTMSDRDRDWPDWEPGGTGVSPVQSKEHWQDASATQEENSTLEVDPRMTAISQTLGEHYEGTFAKHGPTARGVDWGAEEDVRLRYDKMLEVIEPSAREADRPVSLLDVGCGYGGLLEHARQRGLTLDYTGIDVAENLIAYAKVNMPEGRFLHGDVLVWNTAERFDYVVCNGILTQKLSASILDMNRYARAVLERMFALCRRGVAANVMSNRVNFMVENLYYASPVEMLSYCLDHLTRRARLDHAYPLYEYMIYLYRETP
ncbi:MAG: dTDP-4-dehydrorhamnose 3,5-epimerase [Pirellulales bacterium]|nr:dTDP-4-dehydrorhamnose 3,5-epimerase [Pirellulales bacterium]